LELEGMNDDDYDELNGSSFGVEKVQLKKVGEV